MRLSNNKFTPLLMDDYFPYFILGLNLLCYLMNKTNPELLTNVGIADFLLYRTVI